MVVVCAIARQPNPGLPLVVEFIEPQDGDTRQDCELKAAEHWLNEHSENFARQHRPVILANAQYARQVLVGMLSVLL